MKKAIVTGGTGFLGYHLINELINNDVEVLAICRKDSSNLDRLYSLKKVSVLCGNLNEVPLIVEKCQNRDYEVLFHMAWEGASGTLRTSYEVQMNNVQLACKVVELAASLGCRKIVAAGTICENQCETILQMQEVPKSTYYLLAKKYAYEMMLVKCRQIQLKLIWCTFYHPIGIYNKLDQLIANTIWKLNEGIEPQFGPADKWFDIISAEDLVYGFYLAAVKELSENRYYIGSGEPRILSQYLREIGKLINPSVALQFNVFKDDGLPMEKQWLDSSPFNKETGFSVKKSFCESVFLTEQWIKIVKEKDFGIN